MNQEALLQVGAQSFSFREFDFAGSIDCMQRLGFTVIEYCGVHFPPDAGDPGFAGVKAALDAAGIRVPGYGVEGYSDDEAAARQRFEFGKALGVEVLSADPTPEAFPVLDTLCEEFGIKIGIHNHGPEARYNKVVDTLNAVAGHHPFIGACVDTGHALRSGEAPHEVIEQLGDRVHSVHLKDWIIGGDEQTIGEGDMDVIKVAQALKAINFTGPIVLEFELDPEDPIPRMKQGVENWAAAVAAS